MPVRYPTTSLGFRFTIGELRLPLDMPASSGIGPALLIPQPRYLRRKTVADR